MSSTPQTFVSRYFTGVEKSQIGSVHLYRASHANTSDVRGKIVEEGNFSSKNTRLAILIVTFFIEINVIYVRTKRYKNSIIRNYIFTRSVL